VAKTLWHDIEHPHGDMGVEVMDKRTCKHGTKNTQEQIIDQNNESGNTFFVKRMIIFE
jgi:hypothetical protein